MLLALFHIVRHDIDALPGQRGQSGHVKFHQQSGLSLGHAAAAVVFPGLKVQRLTVLVVKAEQVRGHIPPGKAVIFQRKTDTEGRGQRRQPYPLVMPGETGGMVHMVRSNVRQVLFYTAGIQEKVQGEPVQFL